MIRCKQSSEADCFDQPRSVDPGCFECSGDLRLSQHCGGGRARDRGNTRGAIVDDIGVYPAKPDRHDDSEPIVEFALDPHIESRDSHLLHGERPGIVTERLFHLFDRLRDVVVSAQVECDAGFD